MSDAVLDDLVDRGLVQDHTDLDALRARLVSGPITLYAGFDPTASSLHVGNMVPLLLLRRFQDHGHRSIVLAGGATGMIGDPGGRAEERSLLDADQVRANVESVKGQLQQFLDFDHVDPRRGAGRQPGLDRRRRGARLPAGRRQARHRGSA